MILLIRILIHILIAEVAPMFARAWAEAQVFTLLKVAESKKKLMPRAHAKVGKAFLGKAECVECGHAWTVFTREGCDKDVVMECPKCGEPAGGLL